MGGLFCYYSVLSAAKGNVAGSNWIFTFNIRSSVADNTCDDVITPRRASDDLEFQAGSGQGYQINVAYIDNLV